jgi:copper chaperone
MTTSDYDVRGMTCDHCALAVREEVEQIADVTGAAVDLASGRLTVIGTAIDDGAVRAAVAEAGYEAVAA